MIAVEHFCTLFDVNFLPFGLTLRQSLETHAGPYRLWVLCMDRGSEDALRCLDLPNVEIIPLREVETPELLAVKPGRTPGEYCWTMTPFIFGAVFDRAPDASRVTYLDADLYFFDRPSALLSELDESGKAVLITEHAYDPSYDQTSGSGRFCVQFNTFGRDPASMAVNAWWRERCLEWCFARIEEGRFGDQKYLDCWPEKFGDTVHVLRRTDATLAPWNVRHFHRRFGSGLKPVFFHFHGFRPVGPDRARLYMGYRVGAYGDSLYDAYLAAFSRSWRQLADMGLRLGPAPARRPVLEAFRDLARIHVKRTRRYGRIA